MIALYNCTLKDFKNVHLAPIINVIYENQKKKKQNINISKFNTCKTRNIALNTSNVIQLWLF